MSLAIQTLSKGQELCGATAFIVSYGGQAYLVTNWHVASGRSPKNGRELRDDKATPDTLRSLQVVKDSDIAWDWVEQPLYDDEGEPLWLEHPDHGRAVDVVALPTICPDGFEHHPYDPTDPGPPIAYGPSDLASIIGFPFGRSSGGALGVWIQGTIASEPWIDYLDLPLLLIDSRTRSGQSGSPVILYRSQGYTTETGSIINNGIPGCRLVGVYSGRINEESDLGKVWKLPALVEILEAQQRGPAPKPGRCPKLDQL